LSRLAAGAGVLLVVAGLVAWQVGWQRDANRRAPWVGQRRPELASLVAAVGTARLFEPRLAGQFSYGLFEAATRSSAGVPDLSPDVRIAIARLEKTAAKSRSDTDWAALGAGYLISGEFDKSLEFLEAAVATPAPNPVWLSDLSAAYLLIAGRRGQFELVPKALAVAELACRLDDQLGEAAFNRALALEAIHLPGQAQNAWRAYLAFDPDSPWSREARAHLTGLEQAVAGSQAKWADADQTIDAALQQQGFDEEGVSPIRHRLRARLETELIPEWARRELAGDRSGAHEQLRRARTGADLLVRAGGDPMPRDAVRVIENADRLDNRVLVRRLANAHIRLQKALKQFDAGRVAEANEEFRAIEPDLIAAHDPYGNWAAIYEGLAHYGARRFTQARATLTAGALADIDGRYRYLAGRRRWLIGLISANEGRLMPALSDYEDAQANFQAVGELDAEVAVTALLAEVLARLGAAGEAWRNELKALARAVQLGRHGRWPLLLQLGGALSLNADQPAAALHFQDELISVTLGLAGREATLAEGYFHRAQINQRLGDVRAARADLDRASAQLPQIADEHLRRREQAEVSAALADVLRIAAPDAATAAATQAIDFFRDRGGETRIPGLYLRRALAYGAALKFDLAEIDLASAIQHFEEQRNEISTRQYRASFFQDGWQAFAEMARVQTRLHKDAGAALQYAERGRARTLLEAAVNAEAAQPLAIGTIQRALPDDSAALFFAALDDRLFTWSVRRTAVTLVEYPVSASRLRTVISRVRWLLRQSDSDDVRLRTELADLYTELITPVAPSLSNVRTLVVIPDGPLHALPFAALVNPATGRYLVQDFEVMSAPSLSTMVGSVNASWPPGSLRAMVVGNPLRESSADESWVPSLPFSEEEAEQVASTYQGSLLLTAGNATKRVMLDHLGDYDIVHYAGHALVNDQAPALSRLLMASDGSQGDDGSLFVSELSHIRLQRTRLVVLAACSTGTGSITNGEGVQSLARPFLEAGASWVVATFWDIRDRSAAEFFMAFHRRVANGEEPAAALSQTQRQFISGPERTQRSPSRWAWAALIGTIRQPVTR
jgi:CHAT domain-containing protein